MPQIDDAIIEALEADNLQLQNLGAQKYVQLNPMFQDAVADWQKKLGTVDSVLATWGDVQKKWQALESIFVGSADIRVQLPEDSKRFDMVNADYMVRKTTVAILGKVFTCKIMQLSCIIQQHSSCTSWFQPPMLACLPHCCAVAGATACRTSCAMHVTSPMLLKLPTQTAARSAWRTCWCS
jgi:hypothetical protein